MADEVTKKDLQSLQGYVNAKLAAMGKLIEKSGSASNEKEFEDFKRWVEGPLFKRINSIDDRLERLEKKK